MGSVSPGLGQLDTALERFVETFGVDKTLIGVAAKTSSKITDQQVSWEKLIEKLSPAEQKRWLLRLAKGEPLLSKRFQQQLARQSPATRRLVHKRRTVTELLALAEQEREQALRQAHERAEAARIARLKALIPKAEGMWIWAEQLIQRKNRKAYDEAYEQLKQLKELAVYRNQLPEFHKRLDALRARYVRSYSLQDRLRKLGR